MSKRLAATLGSLTVVIAASVASAGTSGAAGTPYGLLRVTTSPALPSQISVDGVPRNTWGIDWAKFTPGDHDVCFGDVQGFTTPACHQVTVAEGATTTVQGAFTQRGYLQVTTSPPSPSQISVDGVPRDNWGLFTDLPVGSHQVCFGAVAGADPPACRTVTVTAGTTTSTTGVFTANSGAPGLTGVGMLRVTTSPARPSQIVVDGIPRNTWGLTWLEIAPGAHQVCFSDVEGATTPACQNVSVAVGATTTVTGSFGARGFLQVSTSPALAAPIAVDGVVMNAWGLYTDLPVGQHQVCFGDVSGYAIPACQTVQLTAGATTSITGTYTSASAGTWVELRKPDDSGSWIPQDANRAGLVVGKGYWCRGNCTTSGTLQMPGGADPAPYQFRTVRDTGAVMAYQVSGTDPVGTIVWTSPNAAPAHLQLPPSWTSPYADLVTSSGFVVGSGIDPGGERRVLLWSSPTASPVTVPLPSSWAYGKVTQVGDDGTLVGWGVDGFDSTYHGLYVSPPDYVAQAMADPGTYPNGGAAMALNSNGLIAGVGFDASDGQHPIAWTSPTTPPTALAMPGGYAFGQIVSVEENGYIIGTAQTSGGAPRVLVWTSPTANPSVLSAPSDALITSLVGVMDDGTIICNASGPGGDFTLIWSSPGSAPFTLSGPPGYSDIVAEGVSTDGVLYAGATDPIGRGVLLAWTSPTGSPTLITAPEAYDDVLIDIARFGAPVLAAGYDAADNAVGLVFIL